MELALCNIALCAIGCAIAYREGRLTHEQLGPDSIPYINHGGMWADWILVTAVAYLAWPYAKDWSTNQIVLCLSASLAVSIIAHLAWASMQTIPGHIIEPSGSDLGKLPIGGWYHLFYMTVSLALVLLFYLCSPGAPLLTVSVLLTIFVVPAVLQPGWYSAKVDAGVGKIDAAGWSISITMWATIWLVGYYRAFGWLKLFGLSEL